MKRIFAAFAAVVVLVSVTACEDYDSESSSAKRSSSVKPRSTAASQDNESEEDSAKSSSADGPDGTYYYTDIDGFNSYSNGSTRNYAVFNDGRFEWFVRGDQYSDKDYYKEYGYACKETGSYEVSDGVIALTYDPINTKEELFDQFPSIIEMYNRKDDSKKEAYIEEMIEYQRKIRKSNEDIRLAVDEEKKIIYQINDPHKSRKSAYNYVAQSIRNKIDVGSNNLENIIELNKDNADKYFFISSEDELDDNGGSEVKKYIEGLLNGIAIKGAECYTAENGFTSNFDIRRHSWLVVMRGQVRCAVVVGENADSDVFGSNNYWVFDAVEKSNCGYKVLDKEISDNFHSIRDVYNYYKSLN